MPPDPPKSFCTLCRSAYKHSVPMLCPSISDVLATQLFETFSTRSIGWVLFGVNFRPSQKIETIMGGGWIFDTGPFSARLRYYTSSSSSFLQIGGGEHLPRKNAHVYIMTTFNRILHTNTPAQYKLTTPPPATLPVTRMIDGFDVRNWQ